MYVYVHDDYVGDDVNDNKYDNDWNNNTCTTKDTPGGHWLASTAEPNTPARASPDMRSGTCLPSPEGGESRPT